MLTERLRALQSTISAVPELLVAGDFRIDFASPRHTVADCREEFIASAPQGEAAI